MRLNKAERIFTKTPQKLFYKKLWTMKNTFVLMAIACAVVLAITRNDNGQMFSHIAKAIFSPI